MLLIVMTFNGGAMEEIINQLKNDYYVYGLYDKDGVLKYVGSGRDNRKDSLSDRSDEYKNILSNGGYTCLITDNMLREEAILEENRLLDINKSCLINKNKSVRLLNYNYDFFDKFLYLDDTSHTGLRWKVPRKRIKKDAPAGTFNKGYLIVSVDYSLYQGHRIIWCLTNKCDLEHYEIINHIDGNPSNNSLDNLEIVSFHINNLKKINYKSNNVGVRYRPHPRNCFEAYATVDGKLCTKHFSINKYGYEEALRLAKDARESMFNTNMEKVLNYSQST